MDEDKGSAYTGSVPWNALNQEEIWKPKARMLYPKSSSAIGLTMLGNRSRISPSASI